MRWLAILPLADLIVAANPEGMCQPIQLRFVSVGDSGLEGMDLAATVNSILGHIDETGVEFVSLLGDNFYPAGIETVQDPVVDSVFRKPWEGVHVPFYPVLGDNDYGKDLRVGSLSAQVDLSRVESRWVMPSLYYSRITPQEFGSTCMLFLDTQSLLSVPNEHSRTLEEIDLLGKQMSWLEKTLASVECQSANFILMFGHHPILSTGKKHHKNLNGQTISNKLLPLMEKYLVDAYFAGHDHDLQTITFSNAGEFNPSFIVSGASSRLRKNPKQVVLEHFDTWGANNVIGYALSELNSEQMVTTFYDSHRHEPIHRHITPSHLTLRLQRMGA